ncbi:MAG: DNA-binding protein [Flavobacteriaceae bacterium]|nr:MAG: DNA-binding protein [Flavobacteriaceae bacterium]
MEGGITKDDLRQFGLSLRNEIREIIVNVQSSEQPELHPGWIKSRKVRAMLDMSAGTLQNLRISGKVRHKKVLGSYYYNEADLKALFDEKGPKR